MSNQREMYRSGRGRIVTMDSAYNVAPDNRGRDIAVNASYCGVLPARFIGAQAPRGAIGVDCGVGPGGASIAGIWYLEALNIPAAVADVMTVRLGDGEDLYAQGIVSFFNRPAGDCGVKVGMPVAAAARLMLENDPQVPDADQVTNRTIVDDSVAGHLIVCTDSIAFGLPEDVDNVLVTAGHTGRSAVPYLRKVRPFGFICSDGGGGREGSGRAGLKMVEADGLAGATVDAHIAAMGDGLSSYRSGVNALAEAAGVEVGMPATQAALLLARRLL
jgi:hypothetical protein